MCEYDEPIRQSTRDAEVALIGCIFVVQVYGKVYPRPAVPDNFRKHRRKKF